jgi:hypothetical protein
MKNALNLKNLFSKKEKSKNESPALIKVKRQMEIAKKRKKQIHAFGGANESNSQAIFIPKRTKRKYWMD